MRPQPPDQAPTLAEYQAHWSDQMDLRQRGSDEPPTFADQIAEATAETARRIAAVTAEAEAKAATAIAEAKAALAEAKTAQAKAEATAQAALAQAQAEAEAKTAQAKAEAEAQNTAQDFCRAYYSNYGTVRLVSRLNRSNSTKVSHVYD